MKTLIVVLVAVTIAASARAQPRVYGNADLGKSIAAETRLAPEEAVRVLRASHSIADLTDYRSPGRGPPSSQRGLSPMTTTPTCTRRSATATATRRPTRRATSADRDIPTALMP